MLNPEIEIRRKIKSTPPGATASAAIGHLSNDEAKACAEKFARAKKLPIDSITVEDGNLTFRRLTADEYDPKPYLRLDELQIGESRLFELPPALHQRVRMAASVRNRKGHVLLCCAREGDFIRVTRQPLTEAEIIEHGFAKTPERASKYGLERLADVREIRLQIGRNEYDTLRNVAHRKANRTGWTIRCRIQDDGSMLVYRTDPGAPQAGAQAAAHAGA